VDLRGTDARYAVKGSSTAVRLSHIAGLLDSQSAGPDLFDLLLLSDRRHRLAAHLVVAGAHVTAGGENVRHFPALGAELRYCAATGELGVVRVGDYEEGAFGFFGLSGHVL